MVTLAVVVPTYNERDNVAPLVEALSRALAGIAWEVVFVDDDSPDGTAARVRELAGTNPRVRVLERIGRRGLSSAAIEGILATAAPFVAVIDADLQHDERLLPRMLERLDGGELDIVVASRFAAEASVAGFARHRRLISRAGTALARLVVPAGLSDPLSGFFMLRRAAFDEAVHGLSGRGFKILVDIFASAPRALSFAELPYQFGARRHGESKLGAGEFVQFLLLVADKAAGRALPAGLIAYAVAAAVGLGAHLGVLGALHQGLAMSFVPAQVAATLAVGLVVFGLAGRARRGALPRLAALALPGVVLGPWLAAALHGAGAGWALAGAAGGGVALAWYDAVLRKGGFR